MPEGDTLHRLAGRVNDRLAGSVCDRCVTRDPRLVGVDLVGATLTDAEAVGKHLFIRFAAADGRRVSLHVHLGMDGAIRIGAIPAVPAWRRRLELGFGPITLSAVDVPVIGLIATADESRLVDHLGPDALDPSVVPAEVASRLMVDPAMPLAAALTDQRNVAGFGNVFAIEVPFICGVDPHQPTGSITGLAALAKAAIGLIRWSAAHGVRNTTGRKLHTADHWIYGRAGRPCPLCGTTLLGESARDSPWRRVTVWCPTCQPMGETAAVDETRIARLLALHPARRA